MEEVKKRHSQLAYHIGKGRQVAYFFNFPSVYTEDPELPLSIEEKLNEELKGRLPPRGAIKLACSRLDSFERFKQQVEELRKKAVYDTFCLNHYSFLIANTAFYQFEKYLEYELEQYKIKNNVNYEQMLEERKSKENKFDFYNYKPSKVE